MINILILCTGNSCRSQMAQNYLQSLSEKLNVHSAGTNPSNHVHPMAIEVMREVGIDISDNKPKNVNLYVDQPWDYVITVCGGAKEECPLFTSYVKNRLHIGFNDPAKALGNPSDIISTFRTVRDEIITQFKQLYDSIDPITK